MGTTKATKKFQKNHLGDTIKKRKQAQAYKKKIGDRKRKDGIKKPARAKKDNSKVFENMDVEKFFEKGPEVPKEHKKTVESESESENDDEEEIVDDISDEEAGSSEESKDEADSSDESKDSDASSDSSDIEMDQEDLDDLQKEDPEFYNYLKKNDKGLLDFEPVNPMDLVSESEEEEEEEEKKPKSKKASGKVTMADVKAWKENLDSDTPDSKIIQKLVYTLKGAVAGREDEEGASQAITVDSEPTFKALMMLSLKQLPLAVQKLAPFKTSANGAREVVNITDKKLKSRLDLATQAQLLILIELLEGTPSSQMAALILQSAQELLPYFTSRRKVLKKLLKACIDLWGTSQDFETTLAAFAFLNNSVQEYPDTLLSTVLKLAYSGFVKNCKRTNVHTMASINFQKNSMAELYGNDPQTCYENGFDNIRQLALALRNSVSNPTKDSYKNIYNWQFVHALDFWSRMLCVQCTPEKGQTPLRELIFPLVQVTIGTIRLIPSPQFFPLRFYLLRSLIRLSQKTGVFIPLFPLLSEILSSKAFTKKPRNEALDSLDFDHLIRAGQEYLGTRVYQEGISEQFVELAAEYFGVYCKSVAYPELVTPAMIYLRRYIKRNSNSKLNQLLNGLIDKLNANMKYIEKARANIEYGPSNREQVAKFLQDTEWDSTPLGAYVKTQRDVRESKMQILRKALEDAEKEEKEQKHKKRSTGREEDIVLE